MPGAFIVTPAAAAQIRRAEDRQDDVAPLLRLAAKRGVDGDIVYGMGFDDEREQDAKFDCQGVTVLIAPPSLEFLRGASLDFVETAPGEFQFVFFNPNEAATTAKCTGDNCAGCGDGDC
jgi:iron-sulfur cluster assembly accessory protein